MTKKGKTILITLAIIGGIVYLYVGMRYSSKLGLKNFRHFYSSDVTGIIEDVGIKNKCSFVVLKGSDEQYLFSPNTGELNDFEIFELFAKEGDSVYKPPYSDTLKLITSDREYLYTFDKFEEEKEE
jgi:hypothetical protein